MKTIGYLVLDLGRSIFTTFTLILVSLCFITCVQKDDLPDDEIVETSTTITLESHDSQTVICEFVAARDWRALCDAGWASVYPSAGVSGKKKSVTVTVSRNMTSASRSCAVTLQEIGSGRIFATFTIIQPGKEASEMSTEPVQATMPAARNLFAYLHEVYGEKTLSSTIANVAWNIDEANMVYRATGKYPAMATFDYIHLSWSPSNWIDYTDTRVVEDWWNAGGIVSACWHWNVPCTEADMEALQNMTCTPGNGSPNSEGQLTTAFQPKNIFVDGTWEKRFADQTLEKMADMLLLLKNKGIPVIWRPLHEAAGNTYADWNPQHTPMAWFWWGRNGAETYIRLWRHMFDYFASRGLDNLIWVFTGDTHDTPYYPGDRYVDIIGCDIYNQSSAQQLAAQYDGVAGIYSGKLVTLSEMGNLATLGSQWNAGARWLYFMPWYHYNATSLEGHQHADTNWWRDAMSQPFVITRDQLPRF